MNSYLDRKALASQGNRHGRMGEKFAMKKLGAVSTPGSGSIPGFKSDGHTKEYRFENKTTLAESFGLKLSILKKIADEARGYGQMPIVSLSFVTGSGVSVDQGDYIIMRRVDFMELRELADNGGNNGS